MSGFLAGLVIGGLAASGNGQDAPQIMTYQTPPGAVTVVCEDPVNGGVSCFEYSPIVNIMVDACNKVTKLGYSCEKYHVSNRFLIFSNGHLRSVVTEFSPNK